MNHTKRFSPIRLLALLALLSLLFCVGCDGQNTTSECTCNCNCNNTSDTDGTETTADSEIDTDGSEETTTPTKINLYNETAVLDNANYRILLTSDTHHTYLQTYHGISSEDRMQAWVDAIKAEHALRPFDLIVIVGDVSLDHWKWQGGGSYLKDGISTTKSFMEDYVSQLPEDVPVFVLAGNHEQYGNEKWKELVGNDRQGSFVLGDNLFLFLDSFADELDPDYHHDGVSTAPDVAFIQSEMAKYPEHNVYLISHYFDTALASDEFKTIVKDPRVIGLFQGHTHQSSIKNLGADYGYKSVAQTGNFSQYSSATTLDDLLKHFWGFRDLVIVGEQAVSRYIRAESDAYFNDTAFHAEREILYVIPY